MAGVRDIGPPPVDWKEQNNDRDVSQNTPDPEKEETNLSRRQTNESQHGNRINDTEQRSEETISGLPPMGGGKSYPPDLLGQQEDYLAEFDGPTDPTHPHNWPMRTRAIILAVISYTTFSTTFASAIYSPAIPKISEKYHVSPEVATLGVTLYVLGFSAGPVLWGPLSEFKGRRLPLVVGALGTTIFQFAVAVSKDLQSILINRFFAGFFGTSSLTIGGAVCADLFDNRTRGLAVTIFTLCVFIGPMVSPFIGGFIVSSHLGWRWTQYISGIMAALATALNVFFTRESYPPVILAQKADKLRRQTKNWAIHSRHEENEVDLKALFQRTFVRPLHMLIVEPIVLLISIYASFIYGLLYLFLTAFPLIFQGVYGMKPGVSGLPELSAVVGCAITCLVMILRQPQYIRRLKANNNVPVPEWRLIEATVGGVFFAGGMFWLGWAGYRKEVHWMVPIIGGAVTGFGISLVFLQSFNYLIDAYLQFAASALAANTFLRSATGAVFPLFATYMFKAMGIQWAMTLLGCFASLLALVPIVFYYKGAKIRQISKYTPKPASKPAPTPRRAASSSEQSV